MEKSSLPVSPNAKVEGNDVTVIIPAYNAATTITRAVMSATAIASWKIIVVDDGSEDDTADMAEANGAMVIRQTNSGASNARTVGLSHATSDFVIFLDSDDALLPGVLEAVQFLEDNPGTGVVGGRIVRVDSEGRKSFRRQNTLPPKYDTESLLRAHYAPWPQSAAVWRRSALVVSGDLLIPALQPRYAEDFELLLRVSLISKVASVQSNTCLHTMSGGKSVRHAEPAVKQSERVRSYYASFLDIDVDHLSQRAIGDQASWRQFRSQLAEEKILDVLYQITVDRTIIRLGRHKLRQIWRELSTSRYKSY